MIQQENLVYRSDPDQYLKRIMLLSRYMPVRSVVLIFGHIYMEAVKLPLQE
jgi:hypothetical protein